MIGSLLLIGCGAALATRAITRGRAQRRTKDRPSVIDRGIDALFEGTRSRQLDEMHRGGEVAEIDPVDVEIDHNLSTSSVGLAVVSIGAAVAPPLVIVGVPIVASSMWPLFRRAYTDMTEDRRLGVALLDVVAFSGMLVTGHFIVASVQTTLIYTSHKLLRRTEAASQAAMVSVFEQQARSVRVMRDGVEVEVDLDALEPGELVVVHPGSVVPVDGLVVDGFARVDERALTGEAQPAEKIAGSPVYASTLVVEGQVLARVERSGDESVAANIVNILNEAQSFQDEIRSRGDRIVDRGVLPTAAMAGLALVSRGAVPALAVVQSAIGYSMRYAAPLSVLGFLHLASQAGILVRDGRALEQLSEVDTFVFDKTGTLTENRLMVRAVTAYSPHAEMDVLRLAAAAERTQDHVIGHAIMAEADARGVTIPASEKVRTRLGLGLAAQVGEHTVLIGSSRLMALEEISLTPAQRDAERSGGESGLVMVFVAVDDQIAGLIELESAIRPEAQALIEHLHARGASVCLLSGDREAPARRLADTLGIDEVHAEILPEDKARFIEGLRAEGRTVCFVGDGINDAIALKQAHVSISFRGATTAATDSASVILMDGSLRQLVPLLALSAELDANLRTSTVLTIVPGLLCIGGVFFLGFGVPTAVMLYNVELFSSLANSMRPVLRASTNAS